MLELLPTTCVYVAETNALERQAGRKCDMRLNTFKMMECRHLSTLSCQTWFKYKHWYFKTTRRKLVKTVIFIFIYFI